MEADKPKCSVQPSDVCVLADTVFVLRDEVMRLGQVVGKLEAHAAGRSVRMRDLSLTVGGLWVSIASIVWTFNTLGWM
jgi:hypothetical protein